MRCFKAVYAKEEQKMKSSSDSRTSKVICEEDFPECTEQKGDNL